MTTAETLARLFHEHHESVSAEQNPRIGTTSWELSSLRYRTLLVSTFESMLTDPDVPILVLTPVRLEA